MNAPNAKSLSEAISVACSKINPTKIAVKYNDKEVFLPDLNIKISLGLSSGKRVWRATRSFAIFPIDDGEITETEITMFIVPHDNIWATAKEVAMFIAELNVDGAIDSAL